MQMGKYEKHIHCLKQKYQVNIGATTTKVKSRTLPVTFCLNKKKNKKSRTLPTNTQMSIMCPDTYWLLPELTTSLTVLFCIMAHNMANWPSYWKQ